MRFRSRLPETVLGAWGIGVLFAIIGGFIWFVVGKLLVFVAPAVDVGRWLGGSNEPHGAGAVLWAIATFAPFLAFRLHASDPPRRQWLRAAWPSTCSLLAVTAAAWFFYSWGRRGIRGRLEVLDDPVRELAIGLAYCVLLAGAMLLPDLIAPWRQGRGRRYLRLVAEVSCLTMAAIGPMSLVALSKEGGQHENVRGAMVGIALRGSIFVALLGWQPLTDVLRLMMARSMRIFISYSRRDKADMQRLLTCLAQIKPLPRPWSDRRILAGTEWEPEILQQLSRSNVVVLLISPHFQESEWCRTELELALEKRERGRGVVIPILVYPPKHELASLGSLQVLPTGALAISEWPTPEAAWNDVREGVEALLRQEFPAAFRGAASDHS